MTNAQTGNNMIPSNPGIAEQQVRDGAQQVAPQHTGVSPNRSAQQPQQPAVDFWADIEQRVSPNQAPAQGFEGMPEQPVAPVQPESPQAPSEGDPSQLTPEQLAALAEAQDYGQPQQPQQPAQPQVQPQDLETQAIAQLSRTEYAMTEDEANAFVSDPGQVLPGLAP